MELPEVTIYTDGSCKKYDGITCGGWGAVLLCGEHSLYLSGAELNTTNNRMEMTAVIKALEVLTTACKIKLYADSQYVLNGVQTYARIWVKNDWKTSENKDVQNRDLWEKILSLSDKHSIYCNWVKGHSGIEYNEVVDSLAQTARDRMMAKVC